jgi:hypothetical protein
MNHPHLSLNAMFSRSYAALIEELWAISRLCTKIRPRIKVRLYAHFGLANGWHLCHGVETNDDKQGYVARCTVSTQTKHEGYVAIQKLASELVADVVAQAEDVATVNNMQWRAL